MVLIGNQTSCWASRPIEPFEFALTERFGAFEWFPDKKAQAGWDDRDLDGSTRAWIRREAGASGMRLSVHARWQANPLLAESRELLARDLQLARDLGAVLFNIHLFEEQGIAAFVEAIGPLLTQSAEAGMQLSIENTPHHSPESFNELFARLREMNHDSMKHVGMCFDVGHANLASSTLNDYLGFWLRLDPQVPIIHLHLHENWGDADSHLPLFTGPSARDDAGIRGLVERLKKRDFSGSIILEQWPNPPTLLKVARDRLFEIWGRDKKERAEIGSALTPGTGRAISTAEEQALTPGGGRAEPANERAALTPSLFPKRGRADSATQDSALSGLVAGNQQARSWREKLELLSAILAKKTNISTNDLVDVAIYLRFLGTGEIPCVEDGRHFRPAHHAKLSAQIYERLAQVNSMENRFVLREIYPWLPSFDSAFRRAEPLTRIRDIAHRNDIPAELKREIKTTLQNKLHRCAGPEDLATSAALLNRITAERAAYSAEFIEQFEIFHEELQEFFNARSLEQHLAAVKALLPGKPAELVDLFLRQKAGTESSERMAAFETLTRLRRELAKRTVEKSGSQGQALTLADIRLENFAFVLVSQILNELPKTNKNDTGPAELLALAVENLALSGVQTDESQALESELRAWKPADSAAREELLRWRASLLRCRRLAEEFGAAIIGLFANRARSLAHALGVAKHAIRVYCEATIRSHLVFQVSKAADLLLRQTRQQLNLGGWDVLVPGRSIGLAMILNSLTEYVAAARPVVALLKSASGDEEIPKDVVGIALGHELPHLSHLAVRARQAAVVLVTCEDPNEFGQIQTVTGQMISLEAQPDKVNWQPAAQPDRTRAESSPKLVRLPQVQLSAKPAWIPLEQARLDNAGGKAEGARRLGELSAKRAAEFRTPPGLVIPFGAMESALSETSELGNKYIELVKRAGGARGTQLTKILESIRQLIYKLKVPATIIDEVRRRFRSPLAVRSSANGEDLQEFAGAGLYESVLNVPAAEVDAAVRQVWASLWTQRAAESRRAAGIPHDQAHMAVLIQELIDPDFSFVLHTVNPITQDQHELYAEIVIGLGETLVSGASAGSPYRLSYAKDSKSVTILGFANLSQAARPEPQKGVRLETLDYSRIDLSREPEALKSLGQRLGAIGSSIEQALGRPQDIEGAVRQNSVYVVQARAQQGLARRSSASP